MTRFRGRVFKSGVKGSDNNCSNLDGATFVEKDLVVMLNISSVRYDPFRFDVLSIKPNNILDEEVLLKAGTYSYIHSYNCPL